MSADDAYAPKSPDLSSFSSSGPTQPPYQQSTPSQLTLDITSHPRRSSTTASHGGHYYVASPQQPHFQQHFQQNLQQQFSQQPQLYSPQVTTPTYQYPAYFPQEQYFPPRRALAGQIQGLPAQLQTQPGAYGLQNLQNLQGLPTTQHQQSHYPAYGGALGHIPQVPQIPQIPQHIPQIPQPPPQSAQQPQPQPQPQPHSHFPTPAAAPAVTAATAAATIQRSAQQDFLQPLDTTAAAAAASATTSATTPATATPGTATTMPPRRNVAPVVQQPEVEPSPVRTKFPTARIKRIMQADEEVGKVAQQTPIAVGKALELFMIQMVSKSAEVARDKNSKRVTAQMLKTVVESDEQWDFLRDIVGKVDVEEKPPKTPTAAGRVKNESESDDEFPVEKKKGRPGRKKKS